jgi:hypothetical protein
VLRHRVAPLAALLLRCTAGFGLRLTLCTDLVEEVLARARWRLVGLRRLRRRGLGGTGRGLGPQAAGQRQRQRQAQRDP